MPNTVEFKGEQFTLRPSVSEYALAKFARAASRGTSDSMSSIAALMDLLEKVVEKTDWARFDRLADDNDATFEELSAVIAAAFGQDSERPTGRSSDSSDGPSITAPKSGLNSDAKVSGMFPGRPDKQAAVLMAIAG